MSSFSLSVPIATQIEALIYPAKKLADSKQVTQCLRDTQQWIGMAANSVCASLPKYSFPVITAATAKIGLQNLDGSIEEIAYAITYQDECGEYEQLKKLGTQLFQKVISPCLWEVTPKNTAIDNIIALFDDHIHDSRAWFMHSEAGVREPFGVIFCHG